jgi:hypothetical protein
LAVAIAFATAGVRNKWFPWRLGPFLLYPARITACVAFRSTKYSWTKHSCFGVIRAVLLQGIFGAAIISSQMG